MCACVGVCGAHWQKSLERALDRDSYSTYSWHCSGWPQAHRACLKVALLQFRSLQPLSVCCAPEMGRRPLKHATTAQKLMGLWADKMMMGGTRWDIIKTGRTVRSVGPKGDRIPNPVRYKQEALAVGAGARSHACERKSWGRPSSHTALGPRGATGLVSCPDLEHKVHKGSVHRLSPVN